MKKRILSILLILTMMLQLCSGIAFADEVIASGTCGAEGDNLQWAYGEMDGHYALIVTGTGAMKDFEYDEAPWPRDAEIVVIDAGVTSIGAYAFADFWYMQGCVIGPDVSSVNDYAFASVGMEFPSWILFGGDAPTMASDAFSEYYGGCIYDETAEGWDTLDLTQWEYVSWRSVDQNGIFDSGYCGDSDDDYDPDENLAWTMNLDSTLTITGSGAMTGDTGWRDCRMLITKAVLPEGLTNIPTEAFYDCQNMTDVNIPNSVTEIGYGAFNACYALKNISMGAGVQTIGGYAFSGCAMTEIVLPAGLQSIDAGAFSYCTNLKTVTFKGNAPVFENEKYNNIFNRVTATCYYPANNATWTEDVMQDYGGTLEWVAVEGEETPDTTAPVLNVTAPADNSRVWNNVELEASATDEDEKVAITVSYALDNGIATAVMPDENGTYNIYLGNLEFSDEGKTLTVTVTAEDSSGNKTTQSRNYTVDNVPNAATNLTAEVQRDGIFLSWVPSAPDDNVQEYYLLRDGSDGSASRVDLDKTVISYTDTSVTKNVTYYYRVIAQGASGMGQSGNEVTCTFTVDDVAPTISDVWPAAEDKVTLCHDSTLQIAASDATGVVKAEAYYQAGESFVKIGEVTLDQPEAKHTFSLDWDVSDLSGEVTLLYKVYDGAGNCAERTETVTVRPYSAPAVPSGLTAEAGLWSAELNWTYAGDLQTLKQFKVYACDPKGGNAVLLTNVKNYKHTLSELTEGIHWFKVTAEDIYGAESEGALVSVTPVISENEAPVAVIQTAEVTGVTGMALTFSGNGSTDNDVIVSYEWDFGDGTTGEGLNCAHTYADAGKYTVTLTVTDRSGNTNTCEAAVTIYDTLGADATHAVLTVTVMDGYVENTPAVQKATVTVYNEEGFEMAALTDADGKAVLVVPKGLQTVTAAAAGYSAKAQQIQIIGDEKGQASCNVYLAAVGVEIMGGELTVEPMDYEEIVAAGIDVSDPANNHVVKQSVSIRFQPKPELAFDLDIDVMINSAGERVSGTGFGWHTFIIDPDPEPDPDRPNIGGNIDWPTPPKYDVGVFPVGESAFMVIYGQTHWLKEMFNVELIVYNNSYAEDITNCVAELQLPEGLSLANMLEGSQNTSVNLNTIEYIDKTIDGVKVGSPIRQVNWYVRGDAEGEYGLTASVTGKVGGVPFEKYFTADKAVKVYAGSALKLTVTMPKSAYYEKDYVVDFALTNVSDKPIYNLSFTLDSVRQFTAEYLSNGETGEIREVLDETDFASNKTYGLPELAPGDTFNVSFKTTFLYEQEFTEFVMGKIPGLEVGYGVAEVFVTTLEGSTTEIPTEIVLVPVEKISFGQWIWDEALKEVVEAVVDTVVDFVDAVVFGGIPVVKGGIKIIKLGVEIKDEVEGPEVDYEVSVSVTEGVKCVEQEEATSARASTFSLRRSAEPGVLVWTDAERYEISDDGKSMKLLSPGNLFVLRVGETAVEPEIDVTTQYLDHDGEVQTFTRTLTADGEYDPELKPATYVVMEPLAENTFAVPEEDDVVSVPFRMYMIGADGEILTEASNVLCTVTDAEGEEVTEGVVVSDGVLYIDSSAKAGTYTVKLAVEDSDEFAEQTVILTKDTDGEDTPDGDDPDKDDPEVDDPDKDDPEVDDPEKDDPEVDDPDKDDPGIDDPRPSRPGVSRPVKQEQEDKPSVKVVPFTDVAEDDWFYDSICYVYGKGLMNGTDAVSFAPDLTTSRAMIVTMLWRLEGSPQVASSTTYADVPENTWYSEAVSWAASEGIVNGYHDAAFGPDDAVTREQLAAILYRYEQYTGGGFRDLWMFRMDYADMSEVSDWAYEALCWMSMHEVISGKPGQIIDPKGQATRAETATMLYRYLEKT